MRKTLDSIQPIIFDPSSTGGDASAANQLTQIAAEQSTAASVAASSSAQVVTPSDTINLSATTRALYIGVTGNLSVIIGGSSVLFTGVPAGSVLNIAVTRINLTGTTATSIVALF